TMINPEIIDKVQRLLLAEESEIDAAGLKPGVKERIMRLREMYFYWIRNPRLNERQIVDVLRKQYELRLSQAYEDAQLLRICIGNIQQVTRQWSQWVFLQRCEEGFEMARKEGNINAFAKMLATFARGTKLSKEENTAPEYDQIVPQQFTVTTDPSVAGFRRIPNIHEKAKKLLQKYAAETEEPIAEYEEVGE
ncbi:MAG: hypothetical protein ACI4V3_05435, partial [Faecousia sp.]